MSSILEALTTIRRHRQAQNESAPRDQDSDSRLDPAHPLTTEELQRLADIVYRHVRHEIRIERERHRGF